MALTLLQPGMEPVGQFDLADGASPVGGECGLLGAAAGVSAADDYAGLLTVTLSGPGACTLPGTAGHGGRDGTVLPAAAPGALQQHGLIDDGSTGYGTLFGTVIGGTAGQGTGLGTSSTVGAVVVGPNSAHASGKATLWDKAGLYGVSDEAWASGFSAADGETAGDGGALNDAVYAVPAGDASAVAAAGAGELCSASDQSGALADADTIAGFFQIGIWLGTTGDTSLVSTSNTAAATGTTDVETTAIYFLGNGGLR